QGPGRAHDARDDDHGGAQPPGEAHDRGSGREGPEAGADRDRARADRRDADRRDAALDRGGDSRPLRDAEEETPMRFLTAEWRDLIHLQYEAPRSLLLPLVPKGTELDRFEGRLLARLVGFRFVGMGIRGIPIPGYGEFEEVNLRFYVVPSGHPDKRAVVFIRELVPTRVVAEAARLTYNE